MIARFAAVALLFLLACAPAAPDTPAASVATVEARAEKQALRVALGGMSANLSPQGYTTNAWIFFPLYDPLAEFGANFEVKPWLATKWEVAADGTTWVITLRNDVKWPDGTALTSDDVAFTIATVLERNWPQRAQIGTVTGAKATSATTVELAARQADASIVAGLPYLWIIPKKYYESVGFDGFAAKPMGSGPYEIVSFKTSDSVEYRKRSTPHAFRKPVVDELSFRAVADANQTINGLRTGEIDMTLLRSFNGDQADAVKAAGLDLKYFPVSNSSPRMPQGSIEARNSPLKDKRVRLAMNYAVDKDAIVSKIYKGYAEPVGQSITPQSLYWDPDIKPIPYDVAQAKRLLAEAGYPNGLKLTGGFDFSPSSVSPDIPLAIQGYLREAGIEIEVVSNEFAIFVDKVLGRNNQQKGDLIFAGTGETNGFNTAYRTSTGCGKPVGAAPEIGYYCNPQWDRLLDQALAERDPAKRRDLYRQAVRVEREDLYAIYTTLTPQFFANTIKVRGFQPALPVHFNLDNVYLVK